MIYTFFDLLATIVLVGCSIRIYFIYQMNDDPRVKIAEAMGYNPIGEAMQIPVILWVICTCWIIARIVT